MARIDARVQPDVAGAIGSQGVVPLRVIFERVEDMAQEDAFAVAGDSLVRGYVYEPHFLSATEEAALIDHIRRLPLKEAEYKQFRAKRRIQSYGARYDFSANQLTAAEPIAAFLHPLLGRVADWMGRSAEDVT
jgi:hypothetical protein